MNPCPHTAECHGSPKRFPVQVLRLIDDTEEEEDKEDASSVKSNTAAASPTQIDSPREQSLSKLQKRTSFTNSRKHAMSMDHSCMHPGHQPGSTAAWLAGGSLGEPSTIHHSHSGSDSGLETGFARPNRRSVNESPHLRVLHDSLLGLTNRLTSSSQGSQESLTSETSSWDSLRFNRGDRTRRRKSKQDARERLQEVLKQCDAGMPKRDWPELESLNLTLETSWDKVISLKDVKEGSRILKQQAAIWELLHTELNILKHLKTIIEVYVVVIKHIQTTSSLLTDVNTERLFLRVEDVFRAHLSLWESSLKPALVTARHTGNPIQPSSFLQGFRDFSVIFHPCIHFCLSNIDSRDYLKQLEKHELFTDFLKWAQRASAKNYNLQEGMVDLKLDSLLTMPAQRIMKYGLLLQEILKYTEDSDERIALQEMTNNVNEFCRDLDDSVRKKGDLEEIKAVISRLDEVKPSDWLDSPTEETMSVVDKFKLDLLVPMAHNHSIRRKIFDSDMKLKDEKGKWFEVKCILFTDLFLVTRHSKKNNNESRLRVLKQPVRLDKLVTHKLASDPNSFLVVVLTDFKTIQSVFILVTPDSRTVDEWIDRINKARTQLNFEIEPLFSATPDVLQPNVNNSSLPMRWLSESGANQDSGQRDSSRRLRAHTVDMHPVHSCNDVTALTNNTPSFIQMRVETSSDVYTPRSPTYLTSRQSSVFFHESTDSQILEPTFSICEPNCTSHNHSLDSTGKEVQQSISVTSNGQGGPRKSNFTVRNASQDSEDEPGGANSIDSGIPDLELSPERRRVLKLINGTRASQV